MNRQQVLDVTSAFPPAQALAEILLDFDYQTAFNRTVSVISTLVTFLVVAFTILRDVAVIWYTNGGREWLIETAQNVRVAVVNAYTVTRQAGANVRAFYELIRSPLFITL